MADPKTPRSGFGAVLKTTITSHKLLTLALVGAVVGAVVLALAGLLDAGKGATRPFETPKRCGGAKNHHKMPKGLF